MNNEQLIQRLYEVSLQQQLYGDKELASLLEEAAKALENAQQERVPDAGDSGKNN